MPEGHPTKRGIFTIYPDGTMFPPISGGFGDDDAPGDDLSSTNPNADPADDQVEEVDHAKEAAKWRAMARKHEAAAKANAEAKKELDALKNAGKSEEERRAAEIADLQARERAATVRALKAEVAASKGLSPELAKFLPDVTDEVDMIDAAEELLAATGTADKGDPQRRQGTPRSNLTSPLGDVEDPSAERQKVLNAMLGKAV